MERMLFMFGLICPNINYLSPIYFRLTVFFTEGQKPLRRLHIERQPSSQLKTSTKEQCYFVNGNSFHGRTRILEVSMVNKNEAWIKQYTESTGNLERRINKGEGKIISFKLDVRQRNLILLLQYKNLPLHGASYM